MTHGRCDEIRDALPDWLHRSLDPIRAAAVQEHLAVCSGCREEADLLEAILHAAPVPPERLEAEIQARLRREMASGTESPTRRGSGAHGPGVVPLHRGTRTGRGWWLSAAALILVSLGVGILSRTAPQGTERDPVQVAAQDPPPEAWLWDDGMVAGAPVFDELSDEELQALIEEFGG